ncbi:MAG: ATP-binding protein [Planctomycetota bacterium]
MAADGRVFPRMRPGLPLSVEETARQISHLLDENDSLWAAELHDDLMPPLFAVAAHLSALKREHPELSEKVQAIESFLDHARERGRRMIARIAETLPPEQHPLDVAVDSVRQEDTFEITETGVAAPITVEHAGSSSMHETWPGPVRMGVYRITQQAIRNARRHADAQTIQVIGSCAHDGNAEGIQIIDDGCGFDPAAVPRAHGLELMRQRAAAAGIQLTVESKPSHGTRVQMVVTY